MLLLAPQIHSKFDQLILGQVQWEDYDDAKMLRLRCYQVQNPDESCDDMYDLHPKSEEDIVKVNEGEKVEDLLIVHCTSDVPRSVIPPIFVILLF